VEFSYLSAQGVKLRWEHAAFYSAAVICCVIVVAGVLYKCMYRIVCVLNNTMCVGGTPYDQGWFKSVSVCAVAWNSIYSCKVALIIPD
jgi:hypothetical protein